MHCIILAAGYATRLSPLTDNFPKPLLKVGPKSILDWLLDDLDQTGFIDGYVVVTNHKFFPHFQNWAASRPAPIQVVDDGTSTNETRLGAVRDILFAMQAANIQDDILVVAGDNLLDFSLASFIQFFLDNKASCILKYDEPDDARLHKCGVLQLDDTGKVLGMVEKPANPPSHWCVPPFYCYTREDAALIPTALAQGCNPDAPGSFAAWLANNKSINAMLMPGKRTDIGNLESYQKACQIWQK